MSQLRRIGVFLADLLIAVLIPEALFYKLCERTGGHLYSVDALVHEQTFVVDPTVRCDRCRQPLPEHVYGQLTDAYAAALADEDAW